MNYCPRCGTPLVEQVVHHQRRPVCPACGFIYFRDPKLAVAVVIERDGRVLLNQRTNEPVGKWSFPAGFVDAGEVVEEAAAREVREETGLEVVIEPILGLYSAAGDPVVLAVYPGRIIHGEATPGDETSAVGWFAPDQLPPLAFARDATILADWQARKGAVPAAQNIEIKVRGVDLAAVRARLATLAPAAPVILRQTDTYFLVTRGRLKLREQDGRQAWLIQYDRPDLAAPRPAYYRQVPVVELGRLRAALAAALGVRGVVAKERAVYHIEHTRVHLDTVSELGDFIELETAVVADDEAAARDECERLLAMLGLATAERVAGSYVDLLPLGSA